MSAHRAARPRRRAPRRILSVTASVAVALGFLIVAEPAHAAATWFVKTAASGGNNASACTSSATACATITGVLAKPAFANGDVIQVAAGSYTERPVFSTKGAVVQGAGAGSTTITNANQANTSTVAVTGAVTVSLSDLTITGGNNNSAGGGGVRVGTFGGSVAASLTLNRVTVSGNTGILGGGVAAYSGTFTATESTIGTNTSTGNNAAGAGVYSLGNTTLTNTAVTGNTASGTGSNLGGGIAAAGTLTINGTSSVTGNKASTQGGGIYANAANLTISGATVSNNQTTAAGSAGGGAYNNAPSPAASITGSRFRGTAANGGTTSDGGGLYVNGGTTNLSGTTIQNSTATRNGVGIYVNAGAANLISGSTVQGGNAGANLGGGVYVAAAGTFNLNASTITGNGASIGAGLYNLGTATTTGGTISGNTATNAAGGVITAGNLSVTGTTISGNSATNAGGGIYEYAGPTTITGAVIKTNTSAQGAGIYANNTATALNVSSSSITNNTATTQGGAITALSPVVTTVTGSTLTGNAGGVQGGAISTSGALNVTDSTVDGNNATTGGALVTTGTAKITGGSLSGNTAVNAGAYYALGTTTIDGTTINGNTADGGTTTNGGNGGAIYNINALTIKNATLTGNKVKVNTNATPGITGYGGAIIQVTFAAATTPSLQLTSSTIDGGAVGGADNAFIGGAIATYPNTVSGGTPGRITLTGSTLTHNIAAAAGAIYTPGQLTMTDSTLDHNKATLASGGNGGAVFAGTSPIVLDNTDVTSNTAGTSASGGGLYVVAGSTLDVRNGSSVTGNTAASGAGILNAATLTIKDSAVEDNNASFAGGGLYTSGVTTLTGATFDGNSAAAFGGGVLTAGGAFTATDGVFNANNAFAGGGVIVGASTQASFDGTDFTDNTSTGANSGGGAILSAGNLTVKNATLTGNTADGTSGLGGAIYSGSSDDNVNTTLKVDSSTLSGNDAYGGSAITASSSGTNDTNKTSITNSTIANNTNSSAAGAIFQAAPMSITHSTITGNTAAGTGAVGGLVLLDRASTSLSANVFAQNTGVTCFRRTTSPVDNGTPVDGGYNQYPSGDTSCGFSAAKHDQAGDPQLGALTGNGGPTQTRMPTAASPVLDKIPAATATGTNDAVSGSAITLCASGALDQRGTTRPQGAKCDLGSVEKVQVAPTVDGPATADYAVGNAGTPLTYTSTGSPQPTLSASGLPSGVTAVDNGDGTLTISGTPAAGTGGVYDVVVTATNEAGSATTALTLTVHQAPVIGGPASATYQVGQAGSTQFTQTSGHPLGTFSSLGTLPMGVTFDGGTPGQGTYSGTPATGTGGVYNLTVKDSNGTPPDASTPFTLTVQEIAGLTGPSTATFKVGEAGASGEFVGSGFPVPSLTSTVLPSGLSLTSTGAGKAKITGTPANGAGNLYTATVTAHNGVGADATKSIAITVNEAPEITAASTLRFVTGVSTTYGVSSDGYPVAALTKTGTLPASISFHDDGNGHATISGTATTAQIGTYSITVKASNGVDPDATKSITVEVVPPLSISTTSLPNAAYRNAYSAMLSSSGGQPPYTYSVVVGSLPAGLSLSSSGMITGSTTANPGTYLFTVKATDSLNPSQSATKVLSITVVKGVTALNVMPILLSRSSGGDITIKIGGYEARLTGGFPAQGISGQTVTFKSNNTTICSGKTDATGHVTCSPTVLQALLVPLNGKLSASYAGNATWLPSSGTAGLIGAFD
jgi:hypothetical protein